MSQWFYVFAVFAAMISLLTQDVIALGLGLIAALLGVVTEDRK